MADTYATYKVWDGCSAPSNLEYNGRLCGQRVSTSDVVTKQEGTCGEWRGDPRHDAVGDSTAHEDDELWCEHCDEELDEDWAFCPWCGRRIRK